MKGRERGDEVSTELSWSRVSHRSVQATSMLDGSKCCVGSGKAAASTSAAAGSTDAHPLEVDETSGPITAPVEVDGQTVNAILLQPMTAEAATEAAGHQMLAPRYAFHGTSRHDIFAHPGLPSCGRVLASHS